MDPLVQGFETLLREDPAAPICVAPGGACTRAELDALAQRIDVQGELVALALPNGPRFLAAMLALRRRGRAALLLDATMPEGAQEASARAFGATAIVRASGVHPVTGAREPQLPRDTAVIKLSSGSTGAPRGIAQSAAALRADTAQLHRTMGITRADRALAVVPMSFSYGLSSLATSALCEGLTLVVPSDDGPMAPLHAARACGATFLPAVPAFLRAMLELAPGALPESVRLVISAGAALAPEVAREFRARFGRKVHAFYGASEVGGIAYDRLGDAAERGTVGTPVDGVRIELSGEDGQVVVRSAALALGYVPDHDPALSGGRFVTSDCATLEHGELRLLGRKSECLNVDGRKVHPREIEAVLLRLPGVEDALVMKTDSPARAGELCWALVACADGALDRARVLEWCRAHLPPYKVPRRVTLVPRIPRNARGKIDEVALRAHVAGE